MNNNNTAKPTKAPSKARMKSNEKRVADLRREFREQSRNPQAAERRDQAKVLNQMARNAQLVRQPRLPRPPKGRTHHPHLSAYASQVSDPRKHSGVPPLFTDNLVQTVQATQVKSTRLATVTVPAGRTIQLSLFNSGVPNIGGWISDTYDGTGFVTGAPGDELAMHERPIFSVTTSGTRNYHCIGPVSQICDTLVGGVVGSSPVAPSFGQISEASSSAGLPVGTFVTSTSNVGGAAAIKWSGLAPTTRPPYAASSVGHARVTNVGLSIEILNTTTQGSRGGDVTSVAPPHEYGVATNVQDQSILTQFKTYQTHAVDRPIHIVVPPRPVDMTYFHPKLNVGGNASGVTVTDWFQGSCTTSLARASLHVFLNNPTAVDQIYRYEIIGCWSIGGNLVAPIATGVPIALETKPAVVQANVELSQKPSSAPSSVMEAFKSAAGRMAQAGFAMGVKALSPDSVMDAVGGAMVRF